MGFMIKVFKEFLSHEHAWDLACSADGAPAHWWSHVVKHKLTKKPLYTQEILEDTDKGSRIVDTYKKA